MPDTPTRIASARALIADCEARLMKAEAAFAADRLAVCELNSTRSMLRRVRAWKQDSDETVTLALGFLGENGWLPLIDRLCDLADAAEADEYARDHAADARREEMRLEGGR